MAGVNGYSVGRDITVNINTASGPLRLTSITGFSAKPNKEEKQIRLLSGRRISLFFPDGWGGQFDVARQDSTLDDYQAQVEADYYSGLGIPTASITETITEPDGSVSQYRYIGVILYLEDAGDWKGNESVNQRLAFQAEQRIKVA